MTNEQKISSYRLLEALDCIDDSFIAHAALYKFKQAKVLPEPDKKKGWLSLRRFAALAACLVLISVIVPVAHYVAVNMNAFLPGGVLDGTSEGTFDDLSIESSLENNTENQTDLADKVKISQKSIPISLTVDEIREIVYSYLKDKNEKYYNYNYSIRCFGKFDDAYAVFIDISTFAYITVITEEKVGGQEFVYTNGHTMKIYKDGEFYSILEAFENGILDEESVRTLAKTFYANYDIVQGG